MSIAHRGFGGARNQTGVHVGLLFAITLIVTVITGVAGFWVLAPAVGWIAGTATYSLWVWRTILQMGPEETSTHATRDDPTRTVAETLLILASVASFGAVALLLVQSGAAGTGAALGLAATALATIAASWVLVHVLFALRYAAIYFGAGGTGIDFNQDDPPEYRDFAYLAFTLGMTYQVSDTNVTSAAIRREVLRHALLSFVLGVIVLASTINLISATAR